jgi:hypothetical protein
VKTLVNDEIEVPADMIKDREPTVNLRLRELDAGRVVLEQLWSSPYVGIDSAWVPVVLVSNAALEPARKGV